MSTIYKHEMKLLYKTAINLSSSIIVFLTIKD